MAIRYAVATGNWSAPGTWDGGATVPVDGDTVYANNFTVSLDVTVNQPNTTLTNASNVSPAITAGGQFRPSVDGITLTFLAITQGISGTNVFSIVAGRTFTVVGATVTGGGTGGTNAIALGTGGFDATFSGCTFVGGSGTAATNGLNVSASGTLQFTNCTTRGGAGTSCHGISLASSGLTFSGIQELSLIQNSSTGIGSRALDITNAFSSTVTFSGSVTHEKSPVTFSAAGGNVTYNVTSETIVTTGLAVGTAGLWTATNSTVFTLNRPSGSLQLPSTNSGPYYLRKSSGTAVATINGDLTCGTGTGTYAVSDDSGGSGSITLNGTLTGPLTTSNQSGISATSGGKVIVKCLARNPTSGQLPSMFGNVLLASDSQIVATTAGGTVTLVPSGSVGDPPSAANVRSGTVYHFGAMTGTCAVPAANQVSVGIPVDATTGTAVLRPQDIPQVLTTTTIATLASQTSFTLTSGSPDDNAYVGMSLIATSVGNSLQKEVGTILAYTGATKTVTLSADPGVYTLAAGDTVSIIAGTSGGGSGGPVTLAASQPNYAPAKAGDPMTLDSATLLALFADVDTGALVASIVANFNEATDLPVDTIAALAASKTVTALATLISDAAAAKIAAQSADGKLTSGRLTRIDALPTATAGTAGGLALHGESGGGGGAGDASQSTLLAVQTTVNGIATTLAGASKITPVGRIAAGGTVTAYIGDDFRVRSGTALPIPIDDPGAVLKAKLDAIGLANLFFGAGPKNGPVGSITGTVSSITAAAGITTISIEISNCGVDLMPGDMPYQIQQSVVQGADFDDFVEIEGTLRLKPRTVAVRG